MFEILSQEAKYRDKCKLMARWYGELPFRQLADAPAGSPIDFVLIAGTVRMALD
jgi:hypothetical protein